MGDVSYAPLISEMKWSYSRVKAFEDCPYRWYLRYIRGFSGKDLFFANYGSLMHSILERYYTGELNINEMQTNYLIEFKDRVRGFAPSQQIFANYFRSGLDYLGSFRPLPYKTLAVEKRVDFTVRGVPAVGFIDYLGESKDGIVIVDNKSRVLKPRSKRVKPTKGDAELDDYLRQLYMYASAIKQEFGVFPCKLCFNCFRNKTLIEEDFSESAMDATEEWLQSSVKSITNETDFRPSIEFFKCRHLCDMQDSCEYYELSKR